MRFPIRATAAFIGVAVSIVIVLDSDAVSSTAAATTRSYLKASPNPVSAKKTTITWQTTSRSAVVRVAVDGHAQKLFAAGSSGTSIAPFIGAGHTYRFSLYASPQSHTELASVVVTSSTNITASPNPASAGKTTIAWRSSSQSAVVRVAEDAQPAKLFAAASSGSSVAQFIVTGHVYRFTLYASPQSHTALATVSVTGATNIAASPNPASAGKTTITWQSPSRFAVVRVVEDGGAAKLFAAASSGSSIASFIAKGHVYRFSLYASPQSHTVLATVVVTF